MTEKNQYIKELSCCDLVVSTARHEFQGLAVLEAAACGAVPLVPDDLAYREIWPAECRYPRAEFKASLAGRIREVLVWRGLEYRSFCRPFDWQRLLPRWAALLGEFA
jgi:glycosyltransferase involved in cell wall biosynthesis